MSDPPYNAPFETHDPFPDFDELRRRARQARHDHETRTAQSRPDRISPTSMFARAPIGPTSSDLRRRVLLELEHERGARSAAWAMSQSPFPTLPPIPDPPKPAVEPKPAGSLPVICPDHPSPRRDDAA